MSRSTMLLFWGLLVLTAGLLVSLNACGGTGGSTPPSSGKIQHVVVIFQENRTPDNLFHGLPHADIANSGLNSMGQTIPLTAVRLATIYFVDNLHSSFVAMYDGGKMDGADKIPTSCKVTGGCPPNPQFTYVNSADVAPYFQMAEQYAFADRMFQSNQGPSFPAHQFIISGTSAPTATSNLFASSNPFVPGSGEAGTPTGCTAPPNQRVSLIDPAGDESQMQYPCFEHPTLADLLDAKTIGWKYYTPSSGSIWTGPNAIQHLRLGPDWSNVVPQVQVLADIANNQLAGVSWVIPTGQESDHSGVTDGSGPSWVASIVNAIGNSPYWSNTVILITWDDWGGWYDHVAPPIYNSYEDGFRVPLIVVSAYAKPAYVSHVTHDFGSMVKFIEGVFGLPSLGYADARADDLSDCFDFSQTPLTFHTIPAELDANFFLNDKRPPTDPDDD